MNKAPRFLRIFISSTHGDMLCERRAVSDEIKRLGHTPVEMDTFGSRNEVPIEVCLQHVRECDVFVLLLGHRYGSLIPIEDVSFTEAEYKAAKSHGKPILVYQRSNLAMIRAEWAESDPASLAKLIAFKKALRSKRVPYEFNSVVELSERVPDDILREADNIATFEPHRLVVNPVERHDRILVSQDYNSNDLFGSSLPCQQTIHSVNDFIWDHQLIPFAASKGFFDRLGLHIAFDKYQIRKSVDYRDPQRGITKEKPGCFLIATPRPLLSGKECTKSTDAAITNVFTGFALIGDSSTFGTYIPSRPIESFRHIMRNVGTKVVLAEDSAVLAFVNAVRSLAVHLGIDTSAMVASIAPRGKAGARFYNSLRNGIQVIVGAAPTRCLAAQNGFHAFFDSGDLMDLILHSRLDRTRQAQLFSQVFTHECWNINLPIAEFEHHMPTLLRLASVAYYAIDYVTRSRTEWAQYLMQEWRNNSYCKGEPLKEAFVKDIVYKCYSFVPFHRAREIYLDSASLFEYERYFESGIAAGKLWNGVSGKVLEALWKNREEYYSLESRWDNVVDRYSSAARSATSHRSEPGPLRCVRFKHASHVRERAHRNFQIHNYYDAVRLISEAIGVLERPHSTRSRAD